MWQQDHKEGWALKNWYFQIVVLEKTLESPLDCKEIKPVNPKEINPEYSLEGLMLKQKLRYFGHLMWRAYLLEKTLMLGKIVGRRRRGDRGRDTMHWLNGHYFEQIPGDSERQGSLKCMGSQSPKSRTLWLNNNLLTHLWQVSFCSLQSVSKATTLLPSTHSFLSTWKSRVPFGWSYLP